MTSPEIAREIVGFLITFVSVASVAVVACIAIVGWVRR